MESYDGSDAIERAWRDGLKPDPAKHDPRQIGLSARAITP
jgi:hypothetical protein